VTFVPLPGPAYATGIALHAALLLFLVTVAPRLGRRRARRLLEDLPTDAGARLRLYRRAMLSAWVAASVAALGSWLQGIPLWFVGLQPPLREYARYRPLGAVTFAVLLAAMLWALWRLRGVREPEALLRAFPPEARALLPETKAERAGWVAVSLSAAFCEELIYRGSLPETMARLTDPFPLRWPEELSWATMSLAFGLGHLYQGARGVAGTFLLGLLLSVPTLATGSLWPAIVLHALFNLRLLALRRTISP
jgi:membrane protease YdiL (CAAX protease family)